MTSLADIGASHESAGTVHHTNNMVCVCVCVCVLIRVDKKENLPANTLYIKSTKQTCIIILCLALHYDHA